MTMQDQHSEPTQRAAMEQCIALCTETHRQCAAYIVHEVSVGGEQVPPHYLRLLHDAAQITLTTANVLERHVPDAARVCAQCAAITHRAAQVVEGRAPDAQMRALIRQCRACAAACRHLTTLLDEQDRS